MRYALHLHAKDLQLVHDGATAVGGAHTWRVVDAESVELAKTEAVGSLERLLRQSSDVLNPRTSRLRIEVEECRDVQASADARNTGLVFYVDTDDPRNAHIAVPPN